MHGLHQARHTLRMYLLCLCESPILEHHNRHERKSSLSTPTRVIRPQLAVGSLASLTTQKLELPSPRKRKCLVHLFCSSRSGCTRCLGFTLTQPTSRRAAQRGIDTGTKPRVPSDPLKRGYRKVNDWFPLLTSLISRGGAGKFPYCTPPPARYFSTRDATSTIGKTPTLLSPFLGTRSRHWGGLIQYIRRCSIVKVRQHLCLAVHVWRRDHVFGPFRVRQGRGSRGPGVWGVG